MRSSLDYGLDIGPFERGDEGAILECLRLCFGRHTDVESWRHVYLNNPAGDPIIILARDQGAVVSHTAFLPRRMQVMHRQVVAAHSLWAMTRPSWQRRGLSRQLAAEAETLARGRGAVVVYGFANRQSIHGILKYQGRRAVSGSPLMVRPVRPMGALLALLTRRASQTADTDSFPLDAARWTAPAFDERHTALFHAADALPPIAIVRDRRYLTWRYPPRAATPYLQKDRGDGSSVDATVVLRPYLRSGIRLVAAMEWLWRRERVGEGRRLMLEAIDLARRSGAHAVAALAMPGTAQRRLLRRMHFVAVPAAWLPDGITLTVRTLGGVGDSTLWTEPSNWYLTLGDSDLM